MYRSSILIDSHSIQLKVKGLLRKVTLFGGRLSLASTAFGAKYQIVLLKNDHVTNLVIEHYHLLSGHSGRDFVLSLAHEKFLIMNAS